MAWIARMWAAIVAAFARPIEPAPPVEPRPPTPTLRQIVSALPTATPAGTALVPAVVQPVAVAPPGVEDEWILVSIIKAHRGNAEQPLKGVSIVAPDDATVDDIAFLFDEFEAQHAGAPVAYLMAAMCQESLFAVNCRNGNYLGKNPGKTNEGTDWGCGQVNGANLPAMFPQCGKNPYVDKWACLIALITSPAVAIPLFCESYLDLLEWADAIIAHTDTEKFPPYVAARSALYVADVLEKVTPKWKNRYWLAALAYNRGRTGSMLELVKGDVVPHPDHVAAYCNAFCTILGQPSLMPAP